MFLAALKNVCLSCWIHWKTDKFQEKNSHPMKKEKSLSFTVIPPITESYSDQTGFHRAGGKKNI